MWNLPSKERLDKIHSFYENYGIITLIFGRFIPFGVRNGLFLTAGLGKMNFSKFALSDLLAASISCSFFFSLYYYLGEAVISVIKKGNIILFSIVAIGVLIVYLKKRKAKKSLQD